MKHLRETQSVFCKPRRSMPAEPMDRLSRGNVTSRSGFTLSELMVVMTIVAIVIGVAGALIHRLLSIESDTTRSARYATSITRLSRVFREDLHAARRVELPEDDDGRPIVLRMTGDGRQEVVYEFDGHIATRTETLEAQRVLRDQFHFPPRSRLECRITDGGRFVQLDIGLAYGQVAVADPVTRTVRIEAAVARDYRGDAVPQEADAP